MITIMNSRLLQFLNAENITQAQFADSIGVARASISHIISGRNKPSYEFISAMMKQYPQLNPEWLILGKGRMYNDSSRQSSTVLTGTADTDLLFPSFPDEAPASDTPQPVPSRMNMEQKEETARELPRENTSGHGRQAPVPSRNAQISARTVSKVIIFFDDGTFQELRG